MKKGISNLIICGGLLTSIITSVGTIETIKQKEKIKIEYQTKIEEYYDELNQINIKKLKEQQEEYEEIQKQYEKEQEAFAKKHEVKIQNQYINRIKNLLDENSDYKKYGVITQRDLSSLKKLNIKINSTSNISFLKYCINLEEITIKCNIDSIHKLKDLPRLQNVKKLKFESDTGEFDKAIAEPIYLSMPQLEELILPEVTTYEPGIIESLTQLKKLEINPHLNCDIDFKQLGHLEELRITSNQPYDIAIWFNQEEYNYLKENNVNIVFPYNTEEKYIEVSKRIDEIVENLQINEEMTDEEILEEVLKFAVKSYTYDDEVKYATEAEIVSKGLCAKFYKGGNLYGALEEKTQICGNYASVVDAIYDRIEKPEKAYTLISDNHAWNLINIDGKEYYVDATWLDAGVIAYGPRFIPADEAADHNILKRMEWYKEVPDSLRTRDLDDGSHISLNWPKYERDNYKKTKINTTKEIIEPIKIETLELPTMKLDIELPDTTTIEKEKQKKEILNNAIIVGNSTLTLLALATTIKIIKNKKSKQKIK